MITAQTKNRRTALFVFLILAIIATLSDPSCGSEENTTVNKSITGPYEPNWASLGNHRAAPDWLRDAKFGIYFHWGVYSVPAFYNEWYPRFMHFSLPDHDPPLEHPVAKHHINTYGHPAEFGYHDFVPMFTGERFDPEEWADLFQAAGARFAGPVAVHHDGFAMWDSDVTPWNADDMGPRRDILGDLFQSLEKRGMKTIATFHHSKNLQRYTTDAEIREQLAKVAPWMAGKSTGWPYGSTHYPKLNPTFPPSIVEDEKLNYLYGNIPEDQWLEEVWLGKLVEVIDLYQPDIIWFDSWLDNIPEEYLQRFSVYYLNAADRWDKDVAIIRKQNDLPLDFSIHDHEKSREPKALHHLWMTDDTLSTDSWSYTKGLKIKSLDQVLHALIDTVSKNGVMLLNISPMADGTIPEDQRSVLYGLGDWLEEHGEAIYDTRPWVVAAEGPTSEPEGGFSDRAKFLVLEYSAADVRYTASKDGRTVYATLLGSPAPGATFTLTAFADRADQITRVELLSGDQVNWAAGPGGLEIIHSADVVSEEPAVVYEITLD
ncbi:MAG: alpha-L-fucosidase [Planctomycetota bacterium]